MEAEMEAYGSFDESRWKLGDPMKYNKSPWKIISHAFLRKLPSTSADASISSYNRQSPLPPTYT